MSVDSKSILTHLPEFGSYLKGLRKERKISRNALAGVIGASASLMHQYESGLVQDPRTDLLEKIAKHYGINYRDVMRQLCQEKYKYDFNNIPVETSMGVAHVNPTHAMEEIKQKLDSIEHAWIFLYNFDWDSQENLQRYASLMKDLLEKNIRVRIYGRDIKLSAFKESLRTELLKHFNPRIVEIYFELEWEGNGNLEPDSELCDSSVLMNEYFFFNGKQCSKEKPAVLLAYTSLPDGELLTGDIITLKPQLAFEKLTQHSKHLFDDGVGERDASRVLN